MHQHSYQIPGVRPYKHAIHAVCESQLFFYRITTAQMLRTARVLQQEYCRLMMQITADRAPIPPCELTGA
nr:hypothetical protein CFP56_09473 [Quercus suber]